MGVEAYGKWGSVKPLHHMDVVSLPPVASHSTTSPLHTHTHLLSILMSNADHPVS